MKARAFFFLLAVLKAWVLWAQPMPEKGMPLLQTFMPAEYDHSGKVWDIQSAPNGIVYMAADKGLLEYDGQTWARYKGSNGFTRSLLIVSDSLIFTGADLDFGVWKKNKLQGFDYTSLYPFQEEIRDTSEEFWDVFHVDGAVIFLSSQNIYVYKAEQLIKIAAPSKFAGGFQVADELFIADGSNGLYILEDFSLKNIFPYPENLKIEITGIFKRDGKLVIVSRNLGTFAYANGQLSSLETELSETLKAAKVFSFSPVGEAHLAFGTVLKGTYITDLEGNLIHHINRHKGLPSNTVLAMHYSANGKLWLGMDYGISSLDIKSQFTFFYDFRGDFGTGQAAALKGSVFYLGSNQGLLRANWDELSNKIEFFQFQLVNGTEGQVWTLRSIGDTLLMGHDKGLFAIHQNAVEQLGGQEGVWTIVPYKDFLLTGNYNGIAVFAREGNSWAFQKKMSLILGSCNQLIVEKENILWVNIPNFGVIRAVLNDELEPIERSIFPEADFEGENIALSETDEGIQLLTDKNRYFYLEQEQRFLLQEQPPILPKIAGLLPGVYQPLSFAPDYDFFPVFNGFVLKYAQQGDIELLQGNTNNLMIRKIEAFNNEAKKLIAPNDKVSYHFNNFRLVFTVPNQGDVLYQFKLNNAAEWSAWTPDNTTELIGLSSGRYTFSVRAKINGHQFSEASVSFKVSPPWYQSWLAKAFYFLLVVLMVYLAHYSKKASLKKQKQRLMQNAEESLRQQAEKHKQEILLLEQERLQAEYEQLKQQLKDKTVELASKARENEEKNRLLISLKEKFEQMQQKSGSFQVKLREVQRLLENYMNIEDKTFEIQIDELHQEFFKKLKAQHPSLSSNDLRLCAYLKIGLNTKEIADILNIQPSSFYISRSRLRKKLGLETEENLYDFLNAI